MARPLSPIRLTGASVLAGSGLAAAEVAVAEGRIVDAAAAGRWPEVDVAGFLLLPGIVDLYGTAFERHLSPSPGLAMPVPSALRATDREAAANGVTTAFIAQHWSWEGGLRGPDFADAALAALEDYRSSALTHLEFALVCEAHTMGGADRILAAAARHGLRLAYFTDTLAVAARNALEAPDRFLEAAGRAGRTAAEHLAEIEALRAASSQVPRHLCTLASGFDGLGMRYGSIGDPDAETREHHSRIGARICGLPQTKQVARAARAVGDPILAAAADILRERSPAPDPTKAGPTPGIADALVSDHSYASLPAAAFQWQDSGAADLARAWHRLSSAPARLAGLTDRGRIEIGLRADLVAIHKDTGAVELTLAGGRVAHASGEAANRLLAAGLSDTALAAE